MVWERIGNMYINLPKGMWDPVEASIKPEPTKPVDHPKRKRRRPRLTDEEYFIEHIEKHRPSLLRIHRGATWRSQLLSRTNVRTLKKHGILAPAREISPGIWVTELTPKAIQHLKLEET